MYGYTLQSTSDKLSSPLPELLWHHYPWRFSPHFNIRTGSLSAVQIESSFPRVNATRIHTLNGTEDGTEWYGGWNGMVRRSCRVISGRYSIKLTRPIPLCQTDRCQYESAGPLTWHSSSRLRNRILDGRGKVARPQPAVRAMLDTNEAVPAGTSQGTGEDPPPAGCNRIKVELCRPLGEFLTFLKTPFEVVLRHFKTSGVVLRSLWVYYWRQLTRLTLSLFPCCPWSTHCAVDRLTSCGFAFQL